jgi:hypothetical protein
MILIDWNVAGSVQDEESLVHAVHNKHLIKAFVSQSNPFSTSRTRRKRDRDTHQRGGMTIE